MGWIYKPTFSGISFWEERVNQLHQYNNMIQSDQNTDLTSWDTKIGRLKRAFDSLTDIDLNFTQGQRQRMIEQLIPKLKVTKKEIDAVMDRVRPFS